MAAIDDKLLKQTIYYDNQNFSLNIDKLYSDWIVKIDKIRSFNSSIQILTNEKKSKKVEYSCVGKLSATELKIQESRCHAFYRMIGLPVVSRNGASFYNPGFDNIPDSKKTIKKWMKKEIYTNPLDGFNDLCKKRAQDLQGIADVFAQVPVSIDASVLALSSGGTKKLRSFSAPLEKVTDGITVVKDQSYDVDYFAKVGDLEVSLTKFKDSGNNPPKNIGYLTKRSHYIAPFIVNGLIDESVVPQSRLVAVPFVPDEKNLQVNAVDKVERPVLEKIIRDRLQNTTQEDAGTNVQKIENYVNQFSLLKDDELINYFKSSSIFKRTTAEKVTNNINAIRALINELVQAEKLINDAQRFYYWVPAPSTSGPEGGSTVQKVFAFKVEDVTQEEQSIETVARADENEQLHTDRDREIIASFFKGEISNPNIEAASQLNFPVPTTDFGATTTEGMGNNNKKNNLSLAEKRNKILSIANNALKTVEIIMGEFGGLGLCDIIVIISALNVLEEKYLLGLLDVDAFERMKAALKLTEKSESAPSLERVNNISDSLNELNKLIKFYYQLMDKVYKDTKQKVIRG